MSRNTLRVDQSSIVNHLQTVFQSAPRSTILSLERHGITDVQPLVPHLAQFEELGELSLSDNSISQLECDLSSIGTLAVLDLSNNPISDLSSTLETLSTLPSLAVLRIDITNSNERRQIIRALPFLQVLNGQATGTDENTEAELENSLHTDQQSGTSTSQIFSTNLKNPLLHDEEEVKTNALVEKNEQLQDLSNANLNGLSGSMIQNVARVYNSIELLFQNTQQQYSNKQAEQRFDEHVTNVLDSLGNRTTRSKANERLTSAYVQAANNALYDVCERRVIEYVDSIVQDANLRKALELLFDAKKRISSEVTQNQIDTAIQANRSERELVQVLQTAEMLEQQVDVETMKNKILTETFEKERSRLVKRINKAKHNTPHKFSNSSLSQSSSLNGRLLIPANKASSQPLSQSMDLEITRGNLDAQPQNISIRQMTLKQLLDVITAVYESKREFDRKCEEARQPKETMQQHLLTYLRKQYGLQSLLDSHALSILQATKKFARRNNDVMVFKKIIDNEFEEKFRDVQSSLKKSIAALLRAYIRSTHKRKSTGWIDSTLKKRTSKTGLIYEKEWVDILKYIYNVEDAMNLTCMLKEMADQQQLQAANNDKPVRGQPRRLLSEQKKKESVHKYAIRYVDFEQVLLNFQLTGHEKFLRQFCNVFRQFDPHGTGILDEKQLRLLVLKINPNKTHRELDQLVADVDPYNNQMITYSQLVDALKDEIEILASGLDPQFPSDRYD